MKKGISIIEVMIFIAILAIAVIGASGYRYFSTLDIRRSDNEITAGRIASQLCESWKGIGGGDSNYNPVNDPGIGLNITTVSSTKAIQPPENFTLLNNGGYYKITSANNGIYYTTMSYRTVSSANGNLETLNVIVSWSPNPSNESDTTRKSLCLSDLLIIH
jgi:Tfp pilus assembly protein PilV